MGTITLLALVIFVVAIRAFVNSSKSEEQGISDKTLKLINELGILGLMVGIISMTISLLGAFDAISRAGSVSRSLLAEGLKITLIPVLYGFIVFVIAKLIQLGMTWKTNKVEVSE